MDTMTLDTLLTEIRKRAASVNFPLDHIEEIDHGYGWESTVAVLHEDRRVHFYFNFFNDDRLTAEVSKGGEEGSLVKRAAIESIDDAWKIIEYFLLQGCDFNALPRHLEWEQGMLGA